MLTSFITSTIWYRTLREANKDCSFIKLATTSYHRIALLRDPLVIQDQFIDWILISRHHENGGSHDSSVHSVSPSTSAWQIRNQFWRLARMASCYFLVTSLLNSDRWVSIWVWKTSRGRTPQPPLETFSVAQGVQLGLWAWSAYQMLLVSLWYGQRRTGLFPFAQ